MPPIRIPFIVLIFRCSIQFKFMHCLPPITPKRYLPLRAVNIHAIYLIGSEAHRIPPPSFSQFVKSIQVTSNPNFLIFLPIDVLFEQIT